MKENTPLSALLQEWSVRPKPHPRFAEGVWARIQAESVPSRRTILPAIGQWLVAFIPKPAYACALLSVSVLAGLALAGMHAANVNQRHDAQMEARYLISIDPVAMANNAQP